jgi:hypothetical protein
MIGFGVALSESYNIDQCRLNMRITSSKSWIYFHTLFLLRDSILINIMRNIYFADNTIAEYIIFISNISTL